MKTLETSVLVPFVPHRADQLTPFANLVRNGRARRLWQGQSVQVETFQAFAAALAEKPFAVGTGVTLMPLRHPYEAAVQARSLALLSGEPVTAGFGTGAKVFQQSLLGAPYARPLTAAAEYVRIIRSLLDEGEVDLHGEYYQVRASLTPVPAPAVDIGLGVLRPGMARTAGQVADVAITWLTPAAYVRDVITVGCADGASAAGRRVPRVASMVPVAVRSPGRSPEEIVLASNAAHIRLPHYVDMLARSGIDVAAGDDVSRARALMRGGAFLYGSPAEIVEQLDAYSDAGAGEVVLNLSGVARMFGPRRALADLDAILHESSARRTSAAEGDPRRESVHLTVPAPGGSDEVPLREAGRRLLDWSTGVHHAHGAVVLSSDEHLDAVLRDGFVEPGVLVLVPGPDSPDPRALRYAGHLERSGHVLVEDSVALRVVAYRDLNSTRPAGPTIVRITCGADLEAFLRDVDVAVDQGDISPVLSDPAVSLADSTALEGRTARVSPQRRLYVDRDGTCRTTPTGVPLGTVDRPMAEIVERWNAVNSTSGPLVLAFGGAVAPADLVTAAASSPWLARFVHAVAAVRLLRARGVPEPRLCGFGGHHCGQNGHWTESVRKPADGDPVLAWDGSASYLVAPEQGRVLAIGGGLAHALDALLHAEDEFIDGLVSGDSTDAVLSRLRLAGIAVMDRRVAHAHH